MLRKHNKSLKQPAGHCGTNLSVAWTNNTIWRVIGKQLWMCSVRQACSWCDHSTNNILLLCWGNTFLTVWWLKLCVVFATATDMYILLLPMVFSRYAIRAFAECFTSEDEFLEHIMKSLYQCYSHCIHVEKKKRGRMNALSGEGTELAAVREVYKYLCYRCCFVTTV